jgi:ribosome-binding factor A
MRRIEKINELLRSELAQLLARDQPVENALVTITYVRCSADLRRAKVGVSVLPENLAGNVRKILRSKNYDLAQILKKKLKMKYIPKWRWEIDASESRAEEIYKIFHHLRNEPHA